MSTTTRTRTTACGVSVYESRPDCPARYHDSYSAFEYAGCHCPVARENHRLYDKRQRHGLLPDALIDTIGARRMIRALFAIGHSAVTIGRAADGMNGSQVADIGSRRARITVASDAAVRRAYARLSGTQGTSDRTRERARRWGYVPPLGWEDVDINDPDAVPCVGGRGEDIVDEVAVARAAHGLLSYGNLRSVEQVEAYRVMAAKGLGPGVIADRLRISTTTLRALEARAREGVAA